MSWLKKGEIVLLSSGSYSDYSVNCTAKVEKDFSYHKFIQENRETFKMSWSEDPADKRYYFEKDKITAELFKQGYLSPFTSKEIHLGDGYAEQVWEEFTRNMEVSAIEPEAVEDKP